ncbi:ATP-binding protein [Arthrobacter sp. 4R501]|uniref:ATP-binding protein n=1 Tax=Arthrobacter sp. 4R501 TaxID=2058886 RepID=UPI0021571BB3|nr:ATP-binding protein [Arthrobacter sp. 4R501]
MHFRAGLFWFGCAALDEFEYGLHLGSGAPGLLTIITGSRGIDQTVMLSAAEAIAKEHGWAVISRTANHSFLAKIGDDMLWLVDELGDGPPTRKITAFSAAGFGLTTQLPQERIPDWRRTGEELLRLLEAKGTGLVITIDEIHAVDRTEISQLASDIQHFIRDGLPIGLMFAGQPSSGEPPGSTFTRPPLPKSLPPTGTSSARAILMSLPT